LLERRTDTYYMVLLVVDIAGTVPLVRCLEVVTASGPNEQATIESPVRLAKYEPCPFFCNSCKCTHAGKMCSIVMSKNMLGFSERPGALGGPLW
jgi:hypothetical protein